MRIIDQFASLFRDPEEELRKRKEAFERLFVKPARRIGGRISEEYVKRVEEPIAKAPMWMKVGMPGLAIPEMFLGTRETRRQEKEDIKRTKELREKRARGEKFTPEEEKEAGRLAREETMKWGWAGVMMTGVVTPKPGISKLNLNKARKTLGVKHGATHAEIKSSYRKLALEHHPDRFAGDPAKQASGREMMAEINKAYENLTNVKAPTARLDPTGRLKLFWETTKAKLTPGEKAMMKAPEIMEKPMELPKPKPEQVRMEELGKEAPIEMERMFERKAVERVAPKAPPKVITPVEKEIEKAVREEQMGKGLFVPKKAPPEGRAVTPEEAKEIQKGWKRPPKAPPAKPPIEAEEAVVIPAEKIKNLERLEGWQDKNPTRRKETGMKELGITEKDLPELIVGIGRDIHFHLEHFEKDFTGGYRFPKLNAYTSEWGWGADTTNIYIYVKNPDGSITKYEALLPDMGEMYEDQIRALHKKAVEEAVGKKPTKPPVEKAPKLKDIKVGDVFTSDMGRTVAVKGFKKEESFYEKTRGQMIDVAVVEDGDTIPVSQLKTWHKGAEIPEEELMREVEEEMKVEAGAFVREEKRGEMEVKTGMDLDEILKNMRATREGQWTLPESIKGKKIIWDEVAEDLDVTSTGTTEIERKGMPNQIINTELYERLVELKGVASAIGQVPLVKVPKVRKARVPKTLYDKLPPKFFKVVKDWEGKVQAVMAEPVPERLAKRKEKAIEKEKRYVTKKEIKELHALARSVGQRLGPGRTSIQMANEVARLIGKATTEGIDVAIGAPYERSKWQAIRGTMIDSIRDYIGKQGSAGEQLSGNLLKARRRGDQLAGEAIANIGPALNALSDGEAARFADVREAGLTPDTPALTKAIEIWKRESDKVFAAARKVGLEVDYRKNFFPHFVPQEVIKTSKGRKAGLQQAVRWAGLKLLSKLNQS